MKSNPGAAAWSGAPLRLTMPSDTVCSSPKGWPSARTSSPTRRRSESPSGSTGSASFASILTSARSTRRSRPTTVPVEPPAGRQPHLDRGRALHHVGVGDHVAVRVDDESRADRAARPVLALGVLGRALDPDLHERRLELVGQTRQRRVEPDELRLRRDDRLLPPELPRRHARWLRAGGPASARLATTPRTAARLPACSPPAASSGTAGARPHSIRDPRRRRDYRPRRPMMWESSGRIRRSTASRQAAGEPGSEKTARPARTPAWARESIAADPISW